MSLAITEKQQQRRPGGCAGILFQLWEWNRRLAKKKLFSRKLLPTVRPAKRASKKFGDDDKMPMAKLLLIADENRGGFPSAKKPEVHHPGNGMRAPGLVARLMGLESMPVVTHEKPRKAMDSGPLYNGDKDSSEVPRLDQDLCGESGGMGKLDSRPPKLQKTGGFLERRSIGGEVVRPNVFGKNVSTTQPRNKHHKLASPVKSPRLLSGSHRARLMQAAATKILEPGLQSRNRSHCAITYMDSSPDVRKVNDNDDTTSKMKISKNLLYNLAAGSSMDFGSVGESQMRIQNKEPNEIQLGSSTFTFSGASSYHNESMHSCTMSVDMQNEESRKKLMACHVRVNMKNNGNEFVERKHNVRKELNLGKPNPDGVPLSIRSNLRQNQLTEVKNKVAFGSKVSSRKQIRKDSHELNGHRVFVSAGRTLNNHSQMRSEGEVIGNYRVGTGRITSDKSMARKRTITSTSNEHIGTNKISSTKEGSVVSHLINQRTNKKCSNSELRRKEVSDGSSGKDNNIVSFTFSSPIRRSTRSCTYEVVAEKEMSDNGLHDPSFRRRLLMDALQHQGNFSGGEISNLMEAKIRELTCVDQDELRDKDARCTATILEELITAFTTGAPLPAESSHNATVRLGPSKIGDLCTRGKDLCDFPMSLSQTLNAKKESQKGAKACASAALMPVENDQSSPVSILEASFSNDSCSVRSVDANSEGKQQSNMTESWNTTSWDMDTDLVDSATSVDVRRLDDERSSNSSERSPSKLRIKLREVGQSRTKLHEVTQAASNAELLLQNVLNESDDKLESSLEPFLSDMLEAIVAAIPLKNNPDYKEAKEADLVKECVLDCMIQSLNSKHDCFYKTWSKLPLFFTREWLRREVGKEVRGWIGLAGKFLDDLIENEMIDSTGRWINYENEALDTSMEIEGDILKALVDEMVMDFCWS